MDNLGYNHAEKDEEEDQSVFAANNNTLKLEQDPNCDNLSVYQDIDLENVEEDVPISGRCGIFSWKPNFLQRFPTKNWFIAVFLVATTIKGMAGSYFPSTYSSLEKRLKISTEMIGYVTSGNEISQILFSLVLSYIAGKGHRPRWIAIGIMSSAVGYFLYSTPHLIYGPGDEALSLTAEHYSEYHSADSDFVNGTDLDYLISKKNFSDDLHTDALCQKRDKNATTDTGCGVGDDSIVPLALVFFSQFIAGIGSVLVYSLAGPFIDDHMKPLHAPMMIAFTGTVRQCGPLIGYIVAYFCLKNYVDPFLTPLITNKDGRWLGAWWLGGLIFSAMMAVVSILIAFFPRTLRTSSEKIMKGSPINLQMISSKQTATVPVPRTRNLGSANKRTEPIYQPSTKDLKLWPSIVELMKNKANLWNNLAILSFGFAFSGFSAYFPKYLETVIKQNAANAALTAGLSSILFQVAGLLLGGYLIAKFSLRARTLVSVNILTDIIIILVLMSFSQLVCKQGQVTITDTTFLKDLSSHSSSTFPPPDFLRNEKYENSQPSINDSSEISPSSACNADCYCTSNQNSPVCYEEKKIIFQSACHAGCKSYDAEKQEYLNCSCLPSPDIALKPGKCIDPDACFSTFVVFLMLLAMVRFFASFGRIGNVLIPYRCVDRNMKSLASGLSFVMWSLVSIPSPILYGKIIDSACIHWGTKCGERGNCLLYDDVTFAYAMSSTAAGLSLFGLISDVMVWYYVKDLKLYGEESDSTGKETKEGNEQERRTESAVE